MHFADGMCDSDIDKLSFATSSGDRYTVSSVVEYTNSPNHFTLWQRDIKQHLPGTYNCG